MRSRFSRLVACLVLLLAAPQLLFAEGTAKLSSKAPTERVEAVLVLDSSGSMRLTDPGKLRDEGARLFAQFLKQGDSFGIIAFADTARVLRPLAEYDSGKASEVSDALGRVGQDGLYTDLLAGVEAAEAAFKALPPSDARRVVVLLSDGKMEPDPQVGTTEQRTDKLLNEVLPDLKAQGVKVHTLYFSDLADKDLLRQIAVATEGVNAFAATADTIHQAFADLFLSVKKPQVLPLTSKGFKIDGNVEEATFYISREGASTITLRSPSGSLLSPTSSIPNAKWFSGQKFEVITIQQPEVGDWVIDGVTQSDGFATVLTNLKLASDFPATVFAGSEALIQARLFEAEKPVVLPLMSGSINFGFRISATDRVAEPIERDFLVDDGTNGDLVAQDGVFSHKVALTEEGEYKLVVIARAPTFERSQQIAFRVRPRMVTLSLSDHLTPAVVDAGHHGKPADHGSEHEDKHEEPETAGHGKEGRAFVVTLSEEAAQLQRSSVKLVAIDGKKRRISIPTQKMDVRGLSYTASVNLLPAAGPYEITAQLTGEAKRGKEVKEESLPLHYVHEIAGDVPEVEVIVHEEHPEEEHVESTSILPYLLVVTLMTALGGGVAFFLMRRASASSAIATPEIDSIDDVKQALAKLEAVAAKTTIELDDPLLADDGRELKLRPGDAPALSGAVTVPEEAVEPDAESATEVTPEEAEAEPPQSE